MRNRYAYGFVGLLSVLIVGFAVYKIAIRQEKPVVDPQAKNGEDRVRTGLDFAEDPILPAAVEKPTIDISDIPAKTSLIGKLGLPFGTLVTVKGFYHGDDQSLYFSADTLNGQKLTTKVTFEPGEIMPFMQGLSGSSGNHFAGDQYDWRFKTKGDIAFRRGRSGERFELLGVENGAYYMGHNAGLTVAGAMYHYGLPNEKGDLFNFDNYARREDHLGFGFVTFFEVIAYKKLP